MQNSKIQEVIRKTLLETNQQDSSLIKEQNDLNQLLPSNPKTVQRAMSELKEVVLDKQLGSAYNSAEEFVNDWIMDLPWDVNDFHNTINLIVYNPSYKQILMQFEKIFKFNLERYLLDMQESDVTQEFYPTNIHLNSVTKKGKMLKEAEEPKTTDMLSVFDDIRTNLQNATSALVIEIPNKYQTLYQKELATLYEKINDAVNDTLQLAKKIKTELQQ
jgi:hypothetical protein